MKKRVIEKFGKKYYLLGRNNEKELVWLEEGHFDCGWYYGLGYVEIFNRRYTDINYHSHFDYMFLRTNKCCYDAFKEYFTETTINDNELWQLLEIMSTLYQLRNTSDLIYQKGSHITSKVEEEKDIFNNTIYSDLYDRINKQDIPRLLNKVYDILSKDGK